MRHAIRNGGRIILVSPSEDIQDFIINGKENIVVDMKTHKYQPLEEKNQQTCALLLAPYAV